MAAPALSCIEAFVIEAWSLRSANSLLFEFEGGACGLGDTWAPYSAIVGSSLPLAVFAT